MTTDRQPARSGFAGRSAVRIAAGSLLVAAAIGLAILWLVKGDELATLRGHRGPVRAAIASADGSVLASAGDDGTIRIWDTATNRERLTFSANAGKIRAIAFGTEPLLASVGDDRAVRLWNWRTGEATGTLAGPKKSLECLAVSPDGKAVAAAGIEGIAYVWRIGDAAPPKALVGHPKHVHGLAFVPDGKTLISSGEDGSIRFWDWTTGTAAGGFPADQRHVHGIAVSPDGAVLAAAVSGRGVRRWSLPDRMELPLLDGAGMARAIAIAPDSRTLGTVHEDGAVKVWDGDSGKLLGTLHGHKKVVLGIAFSPDGKTLATSGGDGTVKRWTVPGK